MVTNQLIHFIGGEHKFEKDRQSRERMGGGDHVKSEMRGLGLEDSVSSVGKV